jgi:hypothetical protein
MTTTERESIRIVRSWLADESDAKLPESIVDAVLEQLPATPQRRLMWPARRSLVMGKLIPLAAAAVVVVAIAGVVLSNRSNPSIGAVMSPAPSPSASASAGNSAAPLPASGAIPAGDYVIDSVDGVRISFVLHVPAGYTSRGEGIEGPHGILSWWIIDNVYRDGCHWQTSAMQPKVGPKVSDLIAALAPQEGRNPAGPQPVTIAGYTGMQTYLAAKATVPFEQCDGGEYRSWITPTGSPGRWESPTDVNDIFALDVKGTRLVFAFTRPDADPDQGETLRKVLDAVDIRP